jgi:cation transport regulator ChaC
MAVVLQEIGGHAGRLLPVLDQLNASAWVAKGASDTYVEQLESSRQQARALADEAKALARNPEKLSGGLQLFFRMEGLETMLTSLEQGARKYQGAQVAQSLAALFGEGGANRERLRDYIVNLAAEREHQFEVMDREAQRCRATLMAPTPPPKTPGRKK